MAENPSVDNTDNSFHTISINNIWKALQRDRWLGLLDAALLASVLLLIFTDRTIFFFHVIFVVLTVGAFFWGFRAFAIRAGIWVTVATAVLVISSFAGAVPAEKLAEIPLLIIILSVVFAITRQRGRAKTALRSERDTLTTIMENTRAHLAYLDPEFNFVRVNSAYVQGCGHSRQDLLGHSHFELFPNAENQAIFEHVRDTGQLVEFHAKPFEFPDQPERGTTYWDWTLAPVTSEDGQVEGLVLSLADVTERERAGMTLREALEGSRQRQVEVSALLEASRAVLAHHEFEDAAHAIFDSCKALIGAKAGYVALLTEDGTENEVLFLDSGGAACSVDPRLPMPIRGLREEAYRAGEVACENDFPNSEWARYLPGGHARLDNVLFAPLLIKGIAVGLLGLANKPGGFTGNDVHLASAFADLAAISLFNSRTLESLQNSEERFRSVAQTAGEAIITIDSRGNMVFWNKAATTMFGYRQDEVIGKPLTFIMPEQFHLAHQNGIQRVLSTGESRILWKTVEMTGLRRDGSEFPVELSLSTWKIKEDIFFTGIVKDVTERVQAEALLRNQNTFITTVFESLSHPFYVIDANDYTIKMANSAADGGELAEGVTCYALTHRRTTPCRGEEHSCALKEIKRTGAPVIVEHTHYDSEGTRRTYEVHGHPIYDDEGKVKQIIEYTVDVTRRKQMEEALRAARDELELRVQERTTALVMANQVLRGEIAEREQAEETLRESEERYRRLVELAFEAIFIHSQGKFVYVNRQAVELLGGVNPEQFIGKPIRDFIHPDYWDMVSTRVRHMGEEGEGVPLVEEKLIRLDGKIVEVEVAGVPITYQGRPAVQSVVHDIGARKRAEAERERERARIARDLHDSLGHSLGYLHLKLDQLTSDNTLGKSHGVRKTLVQMREVANDAYELVRGMLAALLPSNSTDVTATLLFQARSVSQRARFGVQVTSEGQPRPLSPIVQQQLVYLFEEALVNVEKHANARQVKLHLAWEEDNLTVSLSDDGKGFDPDDLCVDGHFGLAIMHERAREINGQLTVSSCPDIGTHLVLRLPFDANSRVFPPNLAIEGIANVENTDR